MGQEEFRSQLKVTCEQGETNPINIEELLKAFSRNNIRRFFPSSFIQYQEYIIRLGDYRFRTVRPVKHLL